MCIETNAFHSTSSTARFPSRITGSIAILLPCPFWMDFTTTSLHFRVCSPGVCRGKRCRAICRKPSSARKRSSDRNNGQPETKTSSKVTGLLKSTSNKPSARS